MYAAFSTSGKNKAAELVQHTDILYASFRDTGGWEWMHVLMYLASASTPSLNSCFLEGELLEGVQRMVDGNEQAYACLTPHLQSCASLGGAFVDAVKELESCREKAVRLDSVFELHCVFHWSHDVFLAVTLQGFAWPSIHAHWCRY